MMKKRRTLKELQLQKSQKSLTNNNTNEKGAN
jgi:hypothetical protein